MAAWQGEEGGEGDRGGGGGGAGRVICPPDRTNIPLSLSPVVFGQARKLMAPVNRDEEK